MRWWAALWIHVYKTAAATATVADRLVDAAAGMYPCVRRLWRRQQLNIAAAVLVLAGLVGLSTFASAPDAQASPHVTVAVPSVPTFDTTVPDIAPEPELEPPSFQSESIIYQYCDLLDAAAPHGTANLIATVLTSEVPGLMLRLLLIADRDVCPSGWLDRGLVETWIGEVSS